MDYDIVEVTSQPMLSMRQRVERAAIGGQFQEVLATVNGVLATRGLTATHQPMGIYHAVDDMSFDVEIGIPIDEAQPGWDYLASETPGGRAARTLYRGPYEGLAAAWEAFARVLEDAGHRLASPCWEVYVNDPMDHPPEAWETELYTRLA